MLWSSDGPDAESSQPGSDCHVPPGPVGHQIGAADRDDVGVFLGPRPAILQRGIVAARGEPGLTLHRHLLIDRDPRWRSARHSPTTWRAACWCCPTPSGSRSRSGLLLDIDLDLIQARRHGDRIDDVEFLLAVFAARAGCASAAHGDAVDGDAVGRSVVGEVERDVRRVVGSELHQPDRLSRAVEFRLLPVA